MRAARHVRRRAPGLARTLGTLALLGHCAAACAQAGPPFLTNDPGTPGDRNWEINVASMQTIARSVAAYQLPQIDVNFGLGDRLQLTFQVPYVLQTTPHQALQRGWSNGYTGIKWRFLDQGGDGWQMSTFPQLETAASAHGRAAGIAAPGPRFFLPVEVARKLGSVAVDLEAGYFFPGAGSGERILGVVAGRSVTDRLELDAEIYDDRAHDSMPRSTTADVGGRYALCPGVIALFMAGRSIDGFSHGQPEFMGYFGIQLLLQHGGHAFGTEL